MRIDSPIFIGEIQNSGSSNVSFTGSFTGSFAGDGSGLTGVGGGVSSYTDLTDVPSNIISSSAQFNALSNTSASFALTASYATNAGISSYTDLTNIPGGLVSGSEQITALGYASSSFNTISVPGQDDIIADSGTDSLTFAAGSGIALSTNASTDTLTITNTGGGGGATEWTDVVNKPSDIVSSSAQVTSLLPGGVVSGSAQIDELFNIDGIISSSNQIAAEISGSFTITSASLATDITTNTSNISTNTSNISTNTSGISTLNSKTLVSSSAQVDLSQATGTAANATSASYALTASYAENAGGGGVSAYGDLTGVPSGIVSGSTQITGLGFTSASFNTISVAGQSDVVADSGTDTLTFVAGTNMTITTNAGGDSITFTSSGGGGGGGAAFPYTGSATISGSLTVDGTATATTFVETSTVRLKENIKDLDFNASDIFKLRPVTFNWKTSGNEDLGFLAEEMNETLPNLVSKTDDGVVEGIKYSKLSTILIKTVQQQQEQINQLKEIVNNLLK